MHISDKQVSTLLDHRSVVEALGQAFTDLAHGRAQIHPRQRSECMDVKLSSMGAIWHTAGVAATKVYTTLSGAFCFAIVLFDTRSNTVLAVLDGQELTRFRTAAITSLVASRVLTRTPRRLTLIGAGVQGRAQVECLAEFFKFEEVCIVDPAVDRGWSSSLDERLKTPVRVMAAEEAVREADIVVTATRSAQPVFQGSWLRPGTFVAAMGTSSPKNRELDDVCLQRAERIYVDWRPQGIEEAGELALWTTARNLAKVFDVAELLTQKFEPASSDITVFKSVGVGLADVAVARLAYERCKAGSAAEHGAGSSPVAP
jgi:ornithine cyclodeaminase